MKYQWIFQRQADIKKIRTLSTQIKNLPQPIINILLQRGITNLNEAKKFFNPSVNDLYDPFLMADMKKAVERLDKALTNNEKILIYGDYDTDGTTAVALMYLFLKKFTNNIDYYIPDRYSEGYGISMQGIEYAAKNKFDLVIALDCGIKAIEQIEQANKYGIDFIICDHHTPGDQLPNATAVLDPKRKDCPYPFKELTGCGIGFKLTQAFTIHKKLNPSIAFEHLDLVAVSTAADIVPITEENRILMYYGLKMLKNTRKKGLKALLSTAQIDKKEKIEVSDCVFKIAPRINAAGRIKHAKNAVKLLITNSETEAQEIANEINLLNSQRQQIDRSIVNEIEGIFEKEPKLKNKHSTVLYNSNWHKGVVGIVASKIIEKYYKPTIILTKSNNKITGSARSVEGFDLYEAISECEKLLENFGGHKYAAGLTLNEENLDQFIECFENSVKTKITDEQKQPKIIISDILTFSQITEKFASLLTYFAPFGPGNPKPIFYTPSVRMIGASKQIGKNNEHLKLELTDMTGNILEALAFGFGEYFNNMIDKTFDICYTIQYEKNNNPPIHLNIKDIKIRL